MKDITLSSDISKQKNSLRVPFQVEQGIYVGRKTNTDQKVSFIMVKVFRKQGMGGFGNAAFL